eukprot:c20829_g1_i1 orf=104-376(+)
MAPPAHLIARKSRAKINPKRERSRSESLNKLESIKMAETERKQGILTSAALKNRKMGETELNEGILKQEELENPLLPALCLPVFYFLHVI